MGLIEKGRMPKPLTALLNLGRSYSVWVYQWGLACCAIEMGAAFASPRYDVMRLGVIPLPASPRQADFVVINGNPAQNIADVRKVDTVFKEGIGYDPKRLIDSVRGQVGLW